jgi:hypothetical protein
MRREAKKWMEEFMSRLKDEITQAKNTAEVSDLEKYFQFFMSDAIKNAVIACVEKHQKDISGELTEITETISSDITESAFGGLDTKIAGNIADISWTKVDSAMFWGNIVLNSIPVSLGRPIYLVGQAIAGFIRLNAVSKRQADFLTPVLQGFGSLANDIVNNMDAVYETLKLSAIDKLQETFQSRIEASLCAINQAKQITADENMKSEEIAANLDSVLAELERLKGALGKYS